MAWSCWSPVPATGLAQAIPVQTYVMGTLRDWIVNCDPLKFLFGRMQVDRLHSLSHRNTEKWELVGKWQEIIMNIDNLNLDLLRSPCMLIAESASIVGWRCPTRTFRLNVTDTPRDVWCLVTAWILVCWHPRTLSINHSHLTRRLWHEEDRSSSSMRLVTGAQAGPWFANVSKERITSEVVGVPALFVVLMSQ